MSHFLYCTADRIGIETGGGVVTHHESKALQELGPCEVWGRERLQELVDYPEPWCWDKSAIKAVFSGLLPNDSEERQQEVLSRGFPKLAHFYAGTFSNTVRELQREKCLVTYTAAAHDVEASRREHEALGIPFHYPHLTEPEQWKQYLEGYLAADVVICPSTYSAKVMKGYGCRNVWVIPHGVNIPDRPVVPLPETFTVGYLGSFGPDKGVRYLLEAWKKLDYRDAVLVLGGMDSTSEWANHLVRTYGGGNIWQMGWVSNVSDFYDSLSLYIQPSVSEGFGLEVLEAMAHGRKVLCSQGAGAVDVLSCFSGFSFEPCQPDAIVHWIEFCRNHDHRALCDSYLEDGCNKASHYTWDKIRSRYQDVWKTLLSEP